MAIIIWMPFLSNCYFTQLRKIQYLLVFECFLTKCDKVIHMCQETVAVWKAVRSDRNIYLISICMIVFYHLIWMRIWTCTQFIQTGFIRGMWQRIKKRPGCFSGTSYKGKQSGTWFCPQSSPRETVGVLELLFF